MRQLEQRMKFAIAMRVNRQCSPLYKRSAFALLTALRIHMVHTPITYWHALAANSDQSDLVSAATTKC